VNIFLRNAGGKMKDEPFRASGWNFVKDIEMDLSDNDDLLGTEPITDSLIEPGTILQSQKIFRNAVTMLIQNKQLAGCFR